MAITITIDDIHNEDSSNLLEISHFLKLIAIRKGAEPLPNLEVSFANYDQKKEHEKAGREMREAMENLAKKNNNFTEEELKQQNLDTIGTQVCTNIPMSGKENPQEIFNPPQKPYTENYTATSPVATQPQQQPIEPQPLDSAGLPYDARIHSESKSINKDGTWRYRRGVKPELIVDVERQLRNEIAANAQNEEYETDKKATETKAFTPPPPPPPPPPPAAPQGVISFASVMGRIARAISANKITKEDVIKILKSVSPILENPAVLGQKTEFVPAVDAALTQVIGA